MKKIIFIFLFFCIQNFSFSQDITKRWNVTIHDLSFSPEHPLPTWNYYGLKTGADTLIGVTSYKKLYKSNDSLFSVASIIGGIREDSNRIYLSKSFYSTGEILLYDFNIGKGDTAIVNRIVSIENPSHYSISAIVDSVNTVVLNGRLKKRMFITYNCIGNSGYTAKDIWIEGIGSITYGLLGEFCACRTGCYTRSFLTCYSEDNVLIWREPTFDNCYVDSKWIVDNIKNVDPENFVSVNRQGKMVQIKSDNPVFSVKAMNLYGQILFEKIHLNTNYFEFSLKEQYSGLLILVVNGRFASKLFY